MATEGYYLSPDTYQRVMRLLNAAGRTSGGQAGGQAATKQVAFVRITSSTATSGWYPCTAVAWNTLDGGFTGYSEAWASGANDEPLKSGRVYLGIRAGARAPASSGLHGLAEFVVDAPSGGCGLKISDDGEIAFDAEAVAGDYLSASESGCQLNVDLPELTPAIIETIPTYVESVYVLTGASDFACQKLQVVTGVELVEDELVVTKKWIQFVGKVTDEEPDTCCGGAVCAAVVPGAECEDCLPPCPDCECEDVYYTLFDEANVTSNVPAERVDDGTTSMTVIVGQVDGIGDMDGDTFPNVYHRVETLWIFCPSEECDCTVDLNNFVYSNWQAMRVGAGAYAACTNKIILSAYEGCGTEGEMIDEDEQVLGDAGDPVPTTSAMSILIPAGDACRVVTVRLYVECYFDGNALIIPVPSMDFDMVITSDCGESGPGE